MLKIFRRSVLQHKIHQNKHSFWTFKGFLKKAVDTKWLHETTVFVRDVRRYHMKKEHIYNVIG